MVICSAVPLKEHNIKKGCMNVDERLKEIIMELREINEDVNMGELACAIYHLQNAAGIMQGKRKSYADILLEYTFF